MSLAEHERDRARADETFQRGVISLNILLDGVREHDHLVAVLGGSCPAHCVGAQTLEEIQLLSPASTVLALVAALRRLGDQP